MDAGAPDRTTLTAFAGAVLIGGGNFLAVKLSNEELEPLYGATLRFAAAALLLFLLARIKGWPLPQGRDALGAAWYGFLGFGLSYALLYFALVELSPGLTSVIIAAAPLLTLALAVAHGQERFTRAKVTGGLLAVAGIGVLSLRTVTGDLEFVHFGAAVIAVVAIAESSVVVKGLRGTHPFTTNAVGMATGAVMLAVGSVAFGESWIVPGDTQTWFVLVWLVIAGSIGLFSLFLYVIARWTASASVYAVTLMPVVAVTLGVLFADEELTVELLLGGVLVLAAVYIGALSQGPPETPTGAEPGVVAEPAH